MATSIPETMSHDVIDEPLLCQSAEGMYLTKVGLKKWKKIRILFKSKKFLAEVPFLMWTFEWKSKKFGDMGTLNSSFAATDSW